MFLRMKYECDQCQVHMELELNGGISSLTDINLFMQGWNIKDGACTCPACVRYNEKSEVGFSCNMLTQPYVYPSGFKQGQKVKVIPESLNTRKYNRHIPFPEESTFTVIFPPVEDLADWPSDAVQIDGPLGQGSIDACCLKAIK